MRNKQLKIICWLVFGFMALQVCQNLLFRSWLKNQENKIKAMQVEQKELEKSIITLQAVAIDTLTTETIKAPVKTATVKPKTTVQQITPKTTANQTVANWTGPVTAGGTPILPRPEQDKVWVHSDKCGWAPLCPNISN